MIVRGDIFVNDVFVREVFENERVKEFLKKKQGPKGNAMKVGKLDLTPQSVTQTIRIGDESGYCFYIQADYDPNAGWRAKVSMETSGFKTAEAAVLQLRHATGHFVRMLENGGEGRVVWLSERDLATIEDAYRLIPDEVRGTKVRMRALINRLEDDDPESGGVGSNGSER